MGPWLVAEFYVAVHWDCVVESGSEETSHDSLDFVNVGVDDGYSHCAEDESKSHDKVFPLVEFISIPYNSHQLLPSWIKRARISNQYRTNNSKNSDKNSIISA